MTICKILKRYCGYKGLVRNIQIKEHNTNIGTIFVFLLRKHTVALFLILSFLSSILSVALTSSEQINQTSGAESDDSKPKEKKSDSKPKNEDKSEDKTKTKDKSKMIQSPKKII